MKKLHSFSMFKPPALWNFLQVFFFMTGLFLTDYSVYGFLPKILTLDGRGFDTTTYSLIYGFALFMAFLGYIFYGWLSDYTGRRRLTLNYCIFLIIFGVPSYYVLYNAAIARNVGMAILGATMAAMLKLGWGIVPAYLSERFPTKRRAVGVGFGYSSGALLGAWFSVYVWWAHLIPCDCSHRKRRHVALPCSHIDNRRPDDFREHVGQPRNEGHQAFRGG